VAASVAIVLLLPVFLAIALLVKLSDPGPVIFRQERVGKHGRPFRLLKFRSMIADAEKLGPAVVRHYTAQERHLLTVRPGLTGPGQLLFSTEQAAELDNVPDPELAYLDRQLHVKLASDLNYLRTRSLAEDLAILHRTIAVLLVH
jgi:lipopolysaccharide/colanic/teichoic acid biosynthesis glycosyltransferase